MESNEKAVQCELCNLWFHCKYEDIHEDTCKLLKQDNVPFYCGRCANAAGRILKMVLDLKKRQDKSVAYLRGALGLKPLPKFWGKFSLLPSYLFCLFVLPPHNKGGRPGYKFWKNYKAYVKILTNWTCEVCTCRYPAVPKFFFTIANDHNEVKRREHRRRSLLCHCVRTRQVFMPAASSLFWTLLDFVARFLKPFSPKHSNVLIFS